MSRHHYHYSQNIIVGHNHPQFIFSFQNARPVDKVISWPKISVTIFYMWFHLSCDWEEWTDVASIRLSVQTLSGIKLLIVAPGNQLLVYEMRAVDNTFNLEYGQTD